MPASSSSVPSKKGVSFSDAVLFSHPDRAGAANGKAVLIQEEPDVFVNAFLGRMTLSAASASSSASSEAEVEGADPAEPKQHITSKSDRVVVDATTPKDACHQTTVDDEDVDYENLVVRMGLVKCGYRYQSVLPLPDYFQRPKVQQPEHAPKTTTDDILSSPASASMNPPTRRSTKTTTVRILEQSIDPDLRGDIGGRENENEEGPQTKNKQQHHDDDEDNQDSTPSSSSYRLTITLGPTRRGPYRGRFALEWSQEEEEEEVPPSVAASVSSSNNNWRRTRTRQQRHHCIMSVQVEATVMGPDMGTPKLRNGVRRLGKIVGYDSDDETTWHGF